MEKINFFVYDLSYKTTNNKTQVYLYGKTQKNKKIIVIDNNFQPYFLVQPKKDQNLLIEKIKNLKLEGKNKNNTLKITNLDTIIKNQDNKEINLIKVSINSPSNSIEISKILKELSEVKEVYEYDLPFLRRYIIDKKIIPLTLIQAQGKFTETGKIPIFNAESIIQFSEDSLKSPKILAFDLETYNPQGKGINPEKNPIIMVSFYGQDFEKVITWKKFKTKKKYIEFVNSEAKLIEKFKQIISTYQPDIITGYFSDGFDFPYIETRAKKYKIPLNIALDKSELIIKKRKTTEAKINGIIHIDIYKFIKKTIAQSMETQRYNLDSVAHELLGKKKTEVNIENLAEVWDKNGPALEKYCEYNLKDSYLAYHLAKKVLPNIIELSKIVKIMPYHSTRMGFSQLIESYLLNQNQIENNIIPSRPNNEELKTRLRYRFKGAFVYEPKAGIYENIIVLDYRSLYPSIISAHNISPDTMYCNCCKNQSKPAPDLNEDYWFCTKRKGFIPKVIDDLINRRMRIKKILSGKQRKDSILSARSETLKLLSNSLYGYYGFFGARWYSKECARSITAWGRYYIQNLIKNAEKQGFKVIYSDTDSVFLLLGKKTKTDVNKFTQQENKELPGLMELEYEGQFKRGIFVSTKTGSGGAKKKYALLDENNEIKVKGFEAVRRNWSPIAKNVQKKVLEIILKEKNQEKAIKYVKKIVNDLRQHKIPVKETIIQTKLQKNIEEYASIGPHVAIAKKMKAQGIEVEAGAIIEYVITAEGKLIRDKAKLPSEIKNNEYDPNYYINNQVLPAVETIFQVMGFKKQDITSHKSQSGLNEFF